MTLSFRNRFHQVLHRLIPDRRRRKQCWLFLRKAAAAWLGREPSTVWLHCDLPFLYDGSVVSLFGLVPFKGWALATRGIESVSYSCDGTVLGQASYGFPRPDVAAMAGYLRQSFRTGFQFHLDTRTLRAGPHRLTLTARSRDGRTASDTCTVLVAHPSSDYESWRRQTTAKPATLEWMRRNAAAFPMAHRVSLLMRLEPDTDREQLDATLRSLQAQAYPHWQLCIGCDKPAYEALADSLADAVRDPRVSVWVDPFAGAGDAPPFPAERATGELLGPVDPGDVLEPDALFEVVYHLNRHADHDLVYSDQDTVLEHGGRGQPVFKPDWPADSLKSGSSFGRLWVARREALAAVGDLATLTDAVAEHDLLQKLAGQARGIGHLKSILYGRWPNARATPAAPLAGLTGLPNEEPVLLARAPYPMLDCGRVRHLLVVMLDHLGDVLLTFPALERLRQLFPEARITALVGSWSASLARCHPCVAEVLTYDFYEASSSQPHKVLAEEEKARIRAWLTPKRFDLALDFRREPETREFLRWSGAWYTAGFAAVGQLEWLTVALPYDWNVQCRRPRRHVSQDALQLVEMLGVFSQREVCPRLPVSDPDQAHVDELLGRLLPAEARLLVAVHPGSGRSIKCWPVEYFAELADRFRERLGAVVVLFGAPEEVPLVEDVLGRMRFREGVVSLAGKLTVGELPAALRRFDLYVGNDSGPTHLAAALALPTLCIGSGTVDPIQWAPLGPAALTIHRRMLCSPCYLRHRDECSFGVACLRDLPVGEVWEAALRVLLPRWSQVRESAGLARQVEGRQAAGLIPAVTPQWGAGSKAADPRPVG